MVAAARQKLVNMEEQQEDNPSQVDTREGTNEPNQRDADDEQQSEYSNVPSESNQPQHSESQPQEQSESILNQLMFTDLVPGRTNGARVMNDFIRHTNETYKVFSEKFEERLNRMADELEENKRLLREINQSIRQSNQSTENPSNSSSSSVDNGIDNGINTNYSTAQINSETQSYYETRRNNTSSESNNSDRSYSGDSTGAVTKDKDNLEMNKKKFELFKSNLPELSKPEDVADWYETVTETLNMSYSNQVMLSDEPSTLASGLKSILKSKVKLVNVLNMLQKSWSFKQTLDFILDHCKSINNTLTFTNQIRQCSLTSKEINLKDAEDYVKRFTNLNKLYNQYKTSNQNQDSNATEPWIVEVFVFNISQTCYRDFSNNLYTRNGYNNTHIEVKSLSHLVKEFLNFVRLKILNKPKANENESQTLEGVNSVAEKKPRFFKVKGAAKAQNNRVQKQVICKRCKKPGHVSPACYTNLSKSQLKQLHGETENETSTSKKEDVNFVNENSTKDETFAIFNINDCIDLNNHSMLEILLDTGAARSIVTTNEPQRIISNYQKIPDKEMLSAANNTPIQVIGRGFFKLKLMMKDIVMIPVLHIYQKDAQHTRVLIAGKTLNDQNLFINTYSMKLVDREEKMVAKLLYNMNNHLTFKDTMEVTNSIPDINAINLDSTELDPFSLHTKLGHCSHKVILKMMQDKVIEASDDEILKFKESIDKDGQSCIRCTLANKNTTRNHRKHGFKDWLEDKAYTKFQLLVADLIGPIRDITEQEELSFKYVLQIFDPISRKRFIYFLLNKDESLAKIEETVTFIKTQYDTQVKSIYTDNGTEFLGDKFYKKLGIIHIIGSAYSSKEYSVIESQNKVLMNVAKRNWLNSTKVPKTLYQFCINYAAYVLNLTTEQRISKLDIKHLLPFGTICLLRQKTRDKLKNVIHLVSIIGFSKSILGAMIYNYHTQKVSHTSNLLVIKNQVQAKELLNATFTKGNLLEDQSINFDQNEVTSMEMGLEMDLENETFENENDEENGDNEITINSVVNNKRCKPNNKYWNVPNIVSDKDLLKLAILNVFENVSQNSQDARIPTTFDEAVKLNEKWIASIMRELESLKKLKVYRELTEEELESLDLSQLIKTRWLFSIKSAGLFKSRIIALGYQEKFRDDENNFAPTLQIQDLMITIKVLLTFFNFKLYVADINTAFLNAKLEHPKVVLLQDFQGSRPVMLNKALYGLRASPSEWYKCLRDKLIIEGFEKFSISETIFIKRDANHQITNVILCYVDDLIIFDKDGNETLTMIAKHFNYKIVANSEETNFTILGMNLNRKVDKNGFTTRIELDLNKYLEKVVQEFENDEFIKELNLKTLPNHETPTTQGWSGPSQDSNFETMSTQQKELRTNKIQVYVGKLLYASIKIRVDILFSVQTLSKYSYYPTKEVFQQLKNIITFLKFNLSSKLVIEREAEVDQGTKKLILDTYIDAAFAIYPYRESPLCYVTFIGKNVVAYGLKTSSRIARSTNEAELMAVAQGLDQSMFFKNIITTIFPEVQVEIQLLTDNSGVLRYISGSERGSSKSIDINLIYLRNIINKSIKLTLIKTEDNLADIVSKNTSTQVFKSIKSHLLK